MEDALRRSASAMRARLRADGGDAAALRESLLAVPTRDRDAWVDAPLEFDTLPRDEPNLPRDAIPYLPCGVDEILAVVREVPIFTDDHFVDLGAGLGRVAIRGLLARRLGRADCAFRHHASRCSRRFSDHAAPRARTRRRRSPDD